ncbi:MAG: fluoride efflux transporter CrcB [Candidatus Nitrospinota bacterium M3_3B_026]
MAYQKFLGLALGGALGALCRYWLSGVAQGFSKSEFPWGTAAVNGIGCFLAGFFWALAVERLAIGGEARTIVMIGFLGAFTTFSTYALETVELARDSQWLWAAGSIALNNAAGIALVIMGLALGRVI